MSTTLWSINIFTLCFQYLTSLSIIFVCLTVVYHFLITHLHILHELDSLFASDLVCASDFTAISERYSHDDFTQHFDVRILVLRRFRHVLGGGGGPLIGLVCARGG